MKQSKRLFARWRLLLLLLIASLPLTACTHSAKPYIAPMPPAIHCASHVPAKPLPPIPKPLTLDNAQVWMAKAIGVYRVEVQRRVTTARCLDGLRKAGVIR